jgi:DNA-binding XRE family transcriptional regulator
MSQLFDENIKILIAIYNDSKYKEDITKAIKAAEIAKQKIEQIEKTSPRLKMCDDFACEFVCPDETTQINDILLVLSKE